MNPMKVPHVLPILLGCLVVLGCSEGSVTAPSPAPAGAPAENHVAPSAGFEESPQLAVSGQQREIAITQGLIVIPPLGTPGLDGRRLVSLRGTQGFRFEGQLSFELGPYAPDFCFALGECGPGAVVSLAGGWGGSDVGGIVKFRGLTFELDPVGTGGSVFLELSGTFVGPPQAPTATVTVPFELRGTFVGGEEEPPGTHGAFAGRGTATLQLQWDDSFGPGLGNWGVVGSRFEIRGRR